MGEVAAGHVEDQGRLCGEGAFPGDGVWLVRGVVGGGEDQLRGRVAIGERRLQRGGDRERGRDARHDLEGDVPGAEGFDLLVGASEDKWVAGFQAQNRLVLARVVQHQFVNAGLGDARLAAALADGDDFSRGAGEIEDGVGDEVVGEDDVGGLEEGVGAEGEEIGRAGAGAAEVDGSGLGLAVH